MEDTNNNEQPNNIQEANNIEETNNTEESIPKYRQKLTGVYHRWNRFWSQVKRVPNDDSNDNEEDADLIEELQQTIVENNEEFQLIMAEANQKLRQLNLRNTEAQLSLQAHLDKLNALIAVSEESKSTHEAEIASISNKASSQKKTMMKKIHSLKKIRDELQIECEKYKEESMQIRTEKDKLEEQLRRASNQDESIELIEMDDNSKGINYWKQKCLAFEAEVNTLRLKYQREMTERRKLYNTLQDLKGNIRVFCRCRPLLPHELRKNAKSVAHFPDDESISIINQQNNQTKKFRFDRVFGPENTNEDVFEETVPYVQSVMDGYNVTIFAYGQTGSGKTFTMSAVNDKAISELFNLQYEKQEEWCFETTVSMLEIYNEQIMDLLRNNVKEKVEYKIRTNGKNSVWVEGLSTIEVKDMNDVSRLMQKGTSNRTVCHTEMNAESSRSHSLFVINVIGRNNTTGMVIKGKLNLIDLAGSERVKKSGVAGKALKEAQNINKSLSALGNVIESLGDKSKHIPYRNSKLTFILQDSLGRSAKTLMFINVSPADYNQQETLTSLNFAQRTKKVELGKAQKNVNGN